MERKFIDTSSDCAICLESLDQDDVIELSCGHRWHLRCLKEQLQHSQPNYAKRLLFSGCRCAKCGVFCDNEALRDLTRRTDHLREKVNVLIQEQLKIDHPNQWKDVTSADQIQSMNEAGLRNYAFYLCSSCDEPYFGGTVDCADLEEGVLTAEDRLCPSCNPHSQNVCRHTEQHRACHIWKCRYCCSPSAFVCYGTVHFCSDCHRRNDLRVKQQQRQNPGSTNPPTLECLPCSGDSCPYPKHNNQSHHQNGSDHKCEQVYKCVLCETSTGTESHFLPSGTQNFVVNPSGELGLRGWTQFGQSSWVDENSELPVNENTTKNFVSSFYWCQMWQKVPLHQYIHDVSSARIEVSAKYMARTDCQSLFKLEAIVLDSNVRVIHRITTDILDAPVDCWERATLLIEPTQGANDVIILIHGKDKPFWSGNYGSKVAECSVRVLCAEEDVPNILRGGTTNLRNMTDS
jgi:F-box associated region/RING-like zinc finger